MEQDLEQAFAYYRKGAEREDLNSLCRLARCYALGIGTRKDREKASALAQEILSRDWEESGELEDYGARAELEALREKAAVESASAAEAKALLSALAAAAQELLDRDEAVRQELSAGEASAVEGTGARKAVTPGLPEGSEQGTRRRRVPFVCLF